MFEYKDINMELTVEIKNLIQIAHPVTQIPKTFFSAFMYSFYYGDK